MEIVRNSPFTEVIDCEEALSRVASSQTQQGGKGESSKRTSPADSKPGAEKTAKGKGKSGQKQSPGGDTSKAGETPQQKENPDLKTGEQEWKDVKGHLGPSLAGDGKVTAEIGRLMNRFGSTNNVGADLAAGELLRRVNAGALLQKKCEDSVQHAAMAAAAAPILPATMKARSLGYDMHPMAAAYYFQEEDPRWRGCKQQCEYGPITREQAQARDWIDTWVKDHPELFPVPPDPVTEDSRLFNMLYPVELSRANPQPRLDRLMKHVTTQRDEHAWTPPEYRTGWTPSWITTCRVGGFGVAGLPDPETDSAERAERRMWTEDSDEWLEEIRARRGAAAATQIIERAEELNLAGPQRKFAAAREFARVKKKASKEKEFDELLVESELGSVPACWWRDQIGGAWQTVPVDEPAYVSREGLLNPRPPLGMPMSPAERVLPVDPHILEMCEQARERVAQIEAELLADAPELIDAAQEQRETQSAQSALEARRLWTKCQRDKANKMESIPETESLRCISRGPDRLPDYDIWHEQLKALYVEEEEADEEVTPAAPRPFEPAVAEDEMRAAGVGSSDGAPREGKVIVGGIAQVMGSPDWPLGARWLAKHGGHTARDAEVLAGTQNRMFRLNGINLIVGQDYDLNKHGEELGFGLTPKGVEAARANRPKSSGSAARQYAINLALSAERNPFTDHNGFDRAMFTRDSTDSFKFVGVQVAPCAELPVVYASIGTNFRAGVRERLLEKEKKFEGTPEDIAKIGRFVNTACGINGRYDPELSLYSVKRIQAWACSFFHMEDLVSGKWGTERAELAINKTLAETFPEMSHKCAVKLEPMVEGKPPRIIIADGDEGQVMAMIVVKCLEDLLFEWFLLKSIKKAPKEQSVRRCVKVLTKKGAKLIEGDGSSWDTTCNARVRALMENPVMWHIMETLVPYGVCPLQWHLAHVAACEKDELKVFFRSSFEKIKAVISPIRRSGHRGTSCLNYWINISNWLCSIFEEPWAHLNPAKRWGIDVTGKMRWWNGCFEGDDSLCALFPAMKARDPLSKMFEGWWDRMGFYMKIVYVKERATFVGWHVCCVDGEPRGPGWECPDLPRAVANMGVSTSPAIRAAAQIGDVVAVKNYAAAKLIAYASNFSGKIPSFSRKCHSFANSLKSWANIVDDEMSFKAMGERGYSYNALEAEIERKNALVTEADEQELLVALGCGTSWAELDAFRLYGWTFEGLGDFAGYRASLPASWQPPRVIPKDAIG